MIGINLVGNYLIGGPGAGSAPKKPAEPPTPDDACRGKAPGSEEYHYCLLENHNDFRQNGMAKSIIIATGQVELFTPGETTAKKVATKIARQANYQTDNWLLLEAARKSIYLFNMTHEKDYLVAGRQMMTQALGRVDHTKNFDVFRFSLSGLRRETTFPTEAYFDLKITEIQVLNITDTALAREKAGKLDQELKDRDFLQAQGSNPVSGGGYLNRLRLFRSENSLHGFADPQALQSVRESFQWSNMMREKGVSYLALYGMNLKDLRYDGLFSKVLEGKLLVQAGRYDEAQKVFQGLLNEPEATRKYGGFLDVGLEALFGLTQIALVTSTTLGEAAQKLEKAFDWTKINSAEQVDLREALGLVVREQSLTDKGKTKLERLLDKGIKGPAEIKGEYSLSMGWTSLAGRDDSPIKSEVKLDGLTPKEKLALIIKQLDYIEYPYGQKEALINAYKMLAGGRKK